MEFRIQYIRAKNNGMEISRIGMSPGLDWAELWREC